MTSTHYDDPTLNQMIKTVLQLFRFMAHQVLRRLSILGPRSDLRNAIEKQLVGCGFTVKVPPEYLGGQNNKTSLIKKTITLAFS